MSAGKQRLVVEGSILLCKTAFFAGLLLRTTAPFFEVARENLETLTISNSCIQTNFEVTNAVKYAKQSSTIKDLYTNF